MCTARKPLLVLAVLFAEACADATTVSEEPDSFELSDVGPSLSVVPYLPPVCGDATTTPLILDDAMQIGSVEVTQGPDNLYVVYRTDPDRPMLATSSTTIGSRCGGRGASVAKSCSAMMAITGCTPPCL